MRCILTLMLLGIFCYAQERQLDFGATFQISPGTGHSFGVGVKGDVVLPINTWIVGKLEADWLHQPKSYLGNGSATHLRGEGRVSLPWNNTIKWKPFVSAGYSFVNNKTNEYSKSTGFPTFGAGINYNNKFVVYWRHYLKENKTQNKGSADLIATEFYQKIKGNWLYKVGIGIQNTRYYQPTGIAKGHHSTWSPEFIFQIGYRF